MFGSEVTAIGGKRGWHEDMVTSAFPVGMVLLNVTRLDPRMSGDRIVILRNGDRGGDQRQPYPSYRWRRPRSNSRR